MRRDGPTPAGAAASARPFVIGLVNNMPDAALASTEQQFRGLLEAAAGSRGVELRRFALAGVPRGDVGRRVLERGYRGPDALDEEGLDGLIVTGTEPRSPHLQDEPYWDEFRRLVDWAQAQSCPTIWSCLAAHGAVLHLDGIERRRYPQKLFGLFECPVESTHPLGAGLGEERCVPQSRFNDLPEERLHGAGYTVLARSAATGADFFVKEAGALFVFLQGHPEYDRHALLREYRRDVGRFLHRERDTYPSLPQAYFAPDVEQALAEFRTQAEPAPEAAALSRLPLRDDDAPVAPRWRSASLSLYVNWLAHLQTRRRPAAAAPASPA